MEEYAGCNVGIYSAAKPEEVVFCKLSITENAAKVLSSMAEKEYDDWYLYIKVVGGGCSGYLYDVQLSDEHPPENTQIIVSQDIAIVINTDDSTLLNDIEIDWNDSLMGGGLKFRNPNATKSCACGISFK
jgi:iron-sulfur cluster assembly protein